MKDRKRMVYTDACTREAVQLVTIQGLSRAQVARDLGISADTIARWLRQLAPAPSAATTMPDAHSTAELARLRRENDVLRMERDSVQKAVGIFSQVPQ